MGTRKKPYEPKEYESARHGKSEKYAGMYLSMIESEAWRALTARQRDLYVHCKLQIHDGTLISDYGESAFTFNRYKWQKKYKLYTASNSRGFYRDMDALILKGFVDCIKQGQRTKEKNIYRLSDRWQHYGLNTYEVPFRLMTASLYRKQFSAVGKSTQGKMLSCGKKYTRKKNVARGVVWKSTQQYSRTVREVV